MKSKIILDLTEREITSLMHLVIDKRSVFLESKNRDSENPFRTGSQWYQMNRLLFKLVQAHLNSIQSWASEDK